MTLRRMLIVDSKTLKARIIDYKTAFEMILNGIPIYGLVLPDEFMHTEDYSTSISLLDLSVEELSKYSGIYWVWYDEFAGIEADIIKGSEIPVRHAGHINFDFSVVLENVVIKNKSFQFNVWYNGYDYDICDIAIRGFYFSNKGELIVVSAGHGHGFEFKRIEEFVSKYDTTKCSKGRFMRKHLF